MVLTRDEELNLEACLKSVAGWLGEVWVVDSGSTDSTLTIARQFDAKVIEHPFTTHAQQWAWALQHVPCQFEWVLGLDADQSVTPELREELTRLFTVDPSRLQTIEGIHIRRRQIFRGSWIRHGGYYPKTLLKLFRRDKVQIDDRDLMDHHFYVAGPVLSLRSDMIEDNRKEARIAFWTEKHNRYAVLHAREELLRRQDKAAWPIEPAFWGSPDQRVVWLKQRWYRLPLYVRPAIYFGYRYFFQLGFLDGKQGFIFHFLQAFWYRLLVDINLDELMTERQLAGRVS
jgi:glycosyltransferase involved in cell wall biosynthesis